MKVIEEFKKESKIYNDVFQKYFADNYDEFMNQIEGGLIVLKQVKSYDSEGLEKREQFMYENIKKLIQANPNLKIYGQFGVAHVPITYQQHWIHLSNWKSLAARLNTNEDSPVKGKVCSTVYFYPGEAQYEQKFYVEPIIAKEDVPLFLKYSNSPLTIFKLDGENTPFKNMDDKFQYIRVYTE